MRFLADENLEAPIVAGLRSAGHDVLYIIELGGSPSDDKVIDLAYRDQRILITNDKGFGEMVSRSKKTVDGVILLRFKKRDAFLKRDVVLKVVHK